MMVQRLLAAKSLSHAQGATLFAGFMKITPLFLIVIPGMISRVLYTGNLNNLNILKVFFVKEQGILFSFLSNFSNQFQRYVLDTVGCVDPDDCFKFCQNKAGCSNIAYPRLVLDLMPSGNLILIVKN